MSRFYNKFKKASAVLLAAALVTVSLPFSNLSVKAQESGFDAEDVVMRVGVLSDPHFAYTDDADASNQVERYKRAITYLNNRADDQLDMVMLGGDYTGTGSEVQATHFAKATKEIMAEINEGKAEEDQAKFIFAYGNHDTDWGGQMTYEGWENVLNQYGVLDDVLKGPEGCYKAKVTNNGKSYFFYSLETYNYNNPTNMFLQEALDWLDAELKAVTTNDPNSYVYVVSHGSVWESGVYGADFEFDRNATWGTAKAGFTGTATDGRPTSSNLNGVLKKYPQVVFFSGHTHRTNILESSIMQKDYTAINVSSVNGGDLFATDPTDFVEDNYGASRPGYVLLVEVDSNGNQRITRINMEDNSICGEPWVMSAPNAEKTHLETYTQEARQKTPVFASGAAFSIDNIAYTEGKEQMTFDVSFDAATCEGYVFRYELVLYDQNGKSIDTKWMVGNWTDHRTGVAEGTSHFDATKFKYSLSVDSKDLFGATGIYATLHAVDEFGGRSEALTWKSQDSLQSVALMRPTGDKANKNLLDGFTTDQIATRTDGAVGIADNGNGSITFTATGNNGQIVYALNDAYSASTMTMWGLLSYYADKLTAIDPADTFVYETDFAKASGGNVFLAFRSPYFTTGSWKGSYTGINLTSSGVELRLGYDDAGIKSEAFKLTDTATHRIKIVSAPSSVSVWVDDIEVFSNQSYTSDNATMYPAIGMFAVNAATFTVGNQLLYLYNSEDQVADSVDALYKEGTEFYDPAAVGCDRNKFQFSSTENKVTVTSKDGTNNPAVFTQRFDDVLEVTDTIITELEYTPTEMTNTDTGVWTPGNIVGIRLCYRADETNGDFASVYLRVNASQNMFYFTDTYQKNMTSEAKVQNGQKVKVKIVSDNTKASVWIDDVLLVDNWAYATINPNVNTANMKPFLQINVTNATWELANISVRKAVETIPNVTSLTEENNLLESQFANISSDIMTSGGAWENMPVIINGTNIYTDMRTSTMAAAGVPSDKHTWQENFTFWGISGNDPKISPNDSYVFSTLAKIYNTTAENGGIVSRYRMRFASYNGVTTGLILDDAILKIMENDTTIAQVDLASKIGYTVGDEIRVTALVSPFGWDVYFDGHHLYSYKVAAGSTVDYRVLQLSTGGARARFLDTSVHYNHDNGELYKEKLLEEVAGYTNARKGIWYEDKAANDAQVAQIKAVCEGLTTTSNTGLKGYVGAINKLIANGKVTNNMIVDGTAGVSETAFINLDHTKPNNGWDWGHIKFVNSGTKMKKGETWVFEADVNCDTGWYNRRLGFGLGTDVDDPEIMVQNGNPHYWGTDWHPVTTISPQWQTGQNWHVKFVVKPFESVQAVYINNADNATLWDKTFAWTELGKTKDAPEDTVFWPRLNFACVDATVTNIYVGYDLTADIAALNTAVTEGKAVDTSGYTDASVKAYEKVLADSAAIVEVCTDAFTNPYSKAEINEATKAIAAAKALLKTPAATLSVGGGDTNANAITIGIADGEDLPVEYVEDKYIIGWTVDGSKVTTYDASVDASKYVAEFIDTDMLDVKKQSAVVDGKIDVRVISSVNNLDYEKAGFAMSLSKKDPTVTTASVRDTTTVYTSLLANGEPESVSDVYPGGYSTHMYAVEITGTPVGTTMYVRAFVELEDGTIVYGATRTITTIATGTAD